MILTGRPGLVQTFLSKKLNKAFAEISTNGGRITKVVDVLKLSGGSVVKLHSDFQFQFRPVSTFDTSENLGLTDLTAALGNFAFVAAIGEVKISAESIEYSKEDRRQASYVPVASITHVYIYVKDNYSFNDDKKESSSQYLGHWNKNGVIVVVPSAAADVANKLVKRLDIELGDYPVTSRIKMFKSVLPGTVYYPIRNRDFRAWRSKFNRGGDMMLYSEPKKINLAKPINVTLERVCQYIE